MTLDEVHWWLAVVSCVATAALRATGEEWKFSAFLTLVTVGLMGE